MAFAERNLFGVFGLVEKVELDGQVLLGLIDQPLEPEFGKEPAHDLHTIFHRSCVDFSVPPYVVMLNFDGDLLAVHQGRPVDLCKAGDAERLRVERQKQLRRLKATEQKKCLLKNIS